MALNNAATGEDTLTNDKLSSLRAVGSGFGYLIYELTTDADFDALKKGCHFVWEALQHTPCLPQYLVSDTVTHALLCIALSHIICFEQPAHNEAPTFAHWLAIFNHLQLGTNCPLG